MVAASAQAMARISVAAVPAEVAAVAVVEEAVVVVVETTSDSSNPALSQLS